MFHLVLYEPEIAPNTGNAIRLAANVGAALHLVRPLGFTLQDRQLKRSGMDYRDRASVTVHDDWPACRAALGQGRYFMVTTRGTTRHDAPAYREGDIFVFGPETRGLPETVLNEVPTTQRVRIPMSAGNRSINLSNAIAVVAYEAWRQIGFAGSS